MTKNTEKVPFTPYQIIVVLILALTQFSVVLDFMVMSPLGDLLAPLQGRVPTQGVWESILG